jgi:hypothetical protein
MSIEWAKKGIVGRGVLIDWYGYMQAHRLDCDPWSFHSISVSIVKQIAKENGIEFQFGDILFLRTGMCFCDYPSSYVVDADENFAIKGS